MLHSIYSTLLNFTQFYSEKLNTRDDLIFAESSFCDRVFQKSLISIFLVIKECGPNLSHPRVVVGLFLS